MHSNQSRNVGHCRVWSLFIGVIIHGLYCTMDSDPFKVYAIMTSGALIYGGMYELELQVTSYEQ